MVRPVNILVEGNLDAAVGVRLVGAVGLEPGTVFGLKGYGYIKEKIAGFNKAAHTVPYLALTDFMDTKLPCPPEVIATWLEHPQELMVFRVVVREIESWLLADQANLSAFLGVPRAKLPSLPERVDDPKQLLVNLARRSSKSSIQRLLVPPEGASGTEGPGYTSELVRFVESDWDIAAARDNATSLERCILALEALGTKL